MKLITTLRQMTDRAAADADAQAILDSADLDSELWKALNCMEDTAENREWLAEQHPDIADNVNSL